MPQLPCTFFVTLKRKRKKKAQDSIQNQKDKALKHFIESGRCCPKANFLIYRPERVCIYKLYIAENLVREFGHIIAFSDALIMLKLVAEFLLASVVP